MNIAASYVLMPAGAPLAPERKTPVAVVQGPQTATVVGEGEIDCDDYGRILVHFHWDLDKRYSMRCRVSQSWAGKGWGGMVIPRIGLEVVVEFVQGDPDKPLVTGCVYNGKNDVPYGGAALWPWVTDVDRGTMSLSSGRSSPLAAINRTFFKKGGTIASHFSNLLADPEENLGNRPGSINLNAAAEISAQAGGDIAIGAGESISVSAAETISTSSGESIRFTAGQSIISYAGALANAFLALDDGALIPYPTMHAQSTTFSIRLRMPGYEPMPGEVSTPDAQCLDAGSDYGRRVLSANRIENFTFGNSARERKVIEIPYPVGRLIPIIFDIVNLYPAHIAIVDFFVEVLINRTSQNERAAGAATRH